MAWQGRGKPRHPSKTRFCLLYLANPLPQHASALWFCSMSDYAMDDMKPEFAEYEKADRAVREDPDDFDAWEKLIRAAESLEGGLNRNSSPQAIALTRGVFDRFLAKFPLLFGYWKKYADMEFSIAGTEAAEMVSTPMIDLQKLY